MTDVLATEVYVTTTVGVIVVEKGKISEANLSGVAVELGTTDGVADSITDETITGAAVGIGLGACVVTAAGIAVGIGLGACVVTAAGIAVGIGLGVCVGTAVGIAVGIGLGARVGTAVGIAVGTGLGTCVGTAAGTFPGSAKAIGVTNNPGLSKAGAATPDPDSTVRPIKKCTNASTRPKL